MNVSRKKEKKKKKMQNMQKKLKRKWLIKMKNLKK